MGAGSGLGLSMVYGFAEQSNGHVAVYSEVGEGTTIKLYLPRSLDKPAADAPSTEAGTPVGRGETILVIEDDTDVRTVVVTLLSYLGYRVLEAKDGPAALALNPRPRNWTDPKWQASVTDKRILEVVRDGGPSVGLSPLMAPNPEYQDRPAAIHALVKMVRKFKGK